MRIRYFIPLMIFIPALFGFLAHQSGVVPPIPIITVSAVGMILLLLQLEDHKVARFFAELVQAVREAAHHHR
jgi:hypothetical protein